MTSVAVFFAILFVLAPGAMAQSIDLAVSTGQQPSNRISSCPDAVISDIMVEVTNLGGDTDTVELTLDWPADLGFIQPFVTLGSGESSEVSPFWITLPYNLDPGTYFAKVTAESMMTGDAVSEDIEIEVLRCYSVDMDIDDDLMTSCQETQEPVTYDIVVNNNGKFRETYDLSASVAWASFSDTSVTVGSQESFVVSMVLDPPASLAPGMHTVFVTARSEDSYATDTASVDMEIVDCFDFSVDIDPESQESCLGEGRDFEITITNPGNEEDEYTFSGPDWVFLEQDSVTVSAGDSETVGLTALPDDMGIQSFDVEVSSVRDSGASPQTVSGIVNVEECRGVAVIVTPDEANVCKGDDLEFTVSIKNTGSVESTFDLSATFGDLSSSSVTLDGGQSRAISLEVDTSELPEGDVIIEVTAQDGPVTDTGTATVGVDDCFSADLALQPDDVTVCPGASVPYTIRVKNTGKQPDTYTLEFAGETIVTELMPEEVEAITYDFELPFVDEGMYSFTVDLSSENGISLSETSEINMRSSDTCYGVTLEDDAGVVTVGKATTVEVTITNTGEQRDTFQISITGGPDWVFLEPTEVRLAGNEESTLYLYMSPGFGVMQGDYMVALKAESENSEATLEVPVTVPEDITDEDVPTEPPEQPNETDGTGDDNVSINVTTPPENDTGDGSPITGGTVEDRPFWKTAAVALIALIIVAILILRFVLLLKK